MSFRGLFEPRMNQLRMTRRSLMVSAVAAALPSTQAIASERRYRMKLIAGEPLGDDLRAGIDIELDPGWKTYWRMIDSACRTDDLAADFVEGRFNIHRDERRVFDHEYAPAFEWEAAGMLVVRGNPLPALVATLPFIPHNYKRERRKAL